VYQESAIADGRVSGYRYFPSEIIQTYVLHKVELFEEQYDQLFDRCSACKVIEGSDFFKIVNVAGTKMVGRSNE
jgi:hypothetical protein